jgi:hypothetical protein
MYPLGNLFEKSKHPMMAMLSMQTKLLSPIKVMQYTIFPKKNRCNRVKKELRKKYKASGLRTFSRSYWSWKSMAIANALLKLPIWDKNYFLIFSCLSIRNWHSNWFCICFQEETRILLFPNLILNPAKWLIFINGQYKNKKTNTIFSNLLTESK